MTLDPAVVAAQWARELPRDFARRLAAALRLGRPELATLRRDAVQATSAAAMTLAFALTEAGDGPYAAGVLAGRLDALEEQPPIRPVWTGPPSSGTGSRLTLAVVSDLLDDAKHEILLVSYATIPREPIRRAMEAAHQRGVSITLLLERADDNPAFRGLTDPFPGLHAQRWHWPASARPGGASMHAKLLIIDRRTALVGSANLTGPGLERNLECGLFIRGGEIPRLLAEHLRGLQGIQRLS